PVNAADPDARPALTGSCTVNGRRCTPVFQLIADRYLDESYSPDAVAERCGVGAATIRRIAAEVAHVAFEQTIELPVAWTDWAGLSASTRPIPGKRSWPCMD